MPPLLADLIHARGCKLKCEKFLTLPSTTLDIYSHAFDKNKKLAQEKLAEAMGL